MFNFEDVIFYFPWEKDFIIWFQNLGAGTIIHDILNFLNNCFSFCGEEIACIIVVGIIYWGLNKQKGKQICISVFTGAMGFSMIKNIVCRLRPFVAIPEIQNFRDVDGYSFPSGHSTNISCLSYSVGSTYKKKWLKPILIILPLLVALSRTFVGAHFPSDVICGLLLGTLTAFIINKFYSKVNVNVLHFSIIAISLIGLLYCKTSDYYSMLGAIIGFSFACIIEEKHIKFENTTNVLKIITRVLGGCLVYVILMAIIKKCFNLIANPETTLGLYLRLIRYAIVILIDIGLYPAIFKLEKKIFKK